MFNQTRTGITTFSPFAVESSLSAMPVKLTGLIAQRKDKVVQLTWSTLLEVNTAVFNIERSTDGISFESIGTVPAHGISSTKSDYSFIDLQPVNERKSYYRLKSIDIDKRFEYSNILVVGPYKPAIKALTVYPVPVINQLYIITDEPEPMTLTINNMSGQVIKQQIIAAMRGRQGITVNVNALPKGSYFVNLIVGNNISTAIFIK